MVCKVKEPVAEEFHRLRRDLILFTYLHLAASRQCTDALLAEGTTAIAYETVQLPDGSLPLLTPMSEVAGRMAPLDGRPPSHEPGGRSWCAGLWRTRGALRQGGHFGGRCRRHGCGDIGRRHALRRLYPRPQSGPAPTSRPPFPEEHWRPVASSTHAIEETCVDADIVIGAVLVVGAKAPILVSDELVARHATWFGVGRHLGGSGRVLPVHPADHALGSHVRSRGSLFYCVANMPGAVPHTSTHALANATLPYVSEIAEFGWRAACAADPALALGVNVVDGFVVYRPVAEAHGLHYVPLEAVL